MSQNISAEQIFAIALDISTPEKRSAYLDQACGEESELRRRVAALFQRHEQSQGLFESPRPAVDETLRFSGVEEYVGAQIGRYKLLGQIGEGGMGVVYIAQQERPMLRQVALKIIKPGMDTKEVIARFDAERQALALMDHPNIAKVLDAGATESGQPYFAMELVRGIPITDYSDRQQLNTRERLKLFIPVCRAIQHAHQKGVIHRDVKPSNVLVSELHQTPLPKVIDFGVAKAINQRLTERTIYTRHQQMVGTPLYMSPEQADLSAIDVDTRSDIYSLGVLLYELLTGVTPFDQQRFREAAYDEMRRIIREEEPPRPSTRISTLGDTCGTICDRRRTDTKELQHQLRGELDWIVMKALDKDRNRRYETANRLAEDVDRYLRDEPVEACLPSRAYHFGKFARRNKASMAAAAVIAATVLVALGISIRQAGVVRTERNAVVTERDTAQRLLEDLQEELSEKVFLAIMAGDEEKAKEAIDKAQQANVRSESIALFRGQLALYYGRIENAISKLQEVSNQSIAAHAMLAYAYNQAQDFEKMDVALIDLETRLKDAKDELTFTDKLFAAQIMMNGDMIEGKRLVEEALEEHSDSPLAQMIHAQVLTAFAHNTGDLRSLRTALEEIKAAMRWVGEVPGLITAHHMVQHVAFVMGMREEAHIEIDQLHTEWHIVKSMPVGRMGIIRLLADLEDERVPQFIGTSPAITDGEMSYYVPILLRYWQPAKVLEFIERRHDQLGVYGECAKARVLAILPARKRDAEDLCRRLMHDRRDCNTRASCLNTLLLMRNDPQQVSMLAQELLDTSTLGVNYADQVMKYLASRSSSTQFLEETNGLAINRLEALYTIAMQNLAQGNRNAALTTLRECVETQAVHSEQFWWGRAFIKAMEEKVNWTMDIKWREDDREAIRER